jgi:hypothetical protein
MRSPGLSRPYQPPEPPHRCRQTAAITAHPHAAARTIDLVADYGVMAERYEYRVVELREKMMGGKMSGDKLERVLNEHAAQGWQLKAITSADVKGRLGAGGVEGLLVTFERAHG